MLLSETGLEVIRDGEFEDLNLLGGTGLGWFSDVRYTEKIRGPVIANQAIAGYISSAYGCVIADDAETAFWDLHGKLIRKQFYPVVRTENKGVAHSSAVIQAAVIGPNTYIGPGAVIGGHGFEVHNKRLVPHAGYVKIGEHVTIGANTCIDRSVWREPTTIGDETHIDNLVHVAHNVQIGRGCMVVAGTVIGGSAVIGDEVFLGIGVHVRPGVHIGDGAFIGMSVTVLDDVAAGERLTCR